jgi:polyisoprenyl-phosphate glycosyltransferase
MDLSERSTLGVVIPCYNEEEVLPETAQRMKAVIVRLISLGKISGHSRVIFVDDGSRDRTWDLIERLSSESPLFAGIKLSRNKGHQNALVAGLFTVEGDAVISIDADLQDDINSIEDMVDRFLAGADIVYGIRKHRDSDTFFKRVTAQSFYKLMQLLGADSVNDHADYRLMSRRAIESLKQYREVNLYLRGIVPLIGFRSDFVYYERTKRLAGKSKYPLMKMAGFALEAITSFSVVPLRLVTLSGFVIFLGSLGISCWALWVKLFTDAALPGWTSIVLPVYFLGGIQIFCIGMLGEYVGKIYGEVKSRPRFFIEKTVPNATEPASSRLKATSQG